MHTHARVNGFPKWPPRHYEANDEFKAYLRERIAQSTDVRECLELKKTLAREQ